MRKGGGKQKGAQFERDVCRELSLWVSNGTQEDAFWRSSMSGGRSTVAARKGKRLVAQSGDISCIHPVGQAFIDKFYLECKSYANLNFLGLVTGKGRLIEFWVETTKQAASYGKLPLLIAKQNRILPIVVICNYGIEVLHLRKRALLIARQHGLNILPFHEFIRYAERP